MEKELIELICRLLDTIQAKRDVINIQQYEKAAMLRDTEKQILYKSGELMVRMCINEDLDVENAHLIQEEVAKFVKVRYGLDFLDFNTPKALRRHLILEEILKKDY